MRFVSFRTVSFRSLPLPEQEMNMFEMRISETYVVEMIGKNTHDANNDYLVA